VKLQNLGLGELGQLLKSRDAHDRKRATRRPTYPSGQIAVLLLTSFVWHVDSSSGVIFAVSRWAAKSEVSAARSRRSGCPPYRT
jgi:hypothetical protein